jgi:hypothetical protein
MKVLILHGGSCESELRQLRQWLEAEACDVIILDLDSTVKSQASSLTELIADADAVTILVNPELPLAEVQIAILAANSKGKKIIAVKLIESIVIDALEKYGSSSVPLSRQQVVEAVCDDRFAWTDEDGSPREEPETERHKCKKPANKNAAA